MSDSWPGADELDTLFRGACGGDCLALNDFIAAVLDPLVGHLRRRRPGADEHFYFTVAGDAVWKLVRDPTRYDPTRRGLAGFLRMSAEGDLLNALEKEAKHYRNREMRDSVELAPDRGNSSVDPPDDELPSFDDPHLAAEIAGFDATESAVFELMRAGVRATAAYATLLGVGHLPEDEQRRAVKRVKERVFKRLQRAGEKS